MKVLHILNSIMPSGAETMLVSSASSWRECENYVLATEKNLGTYAPVMREAGYCIHHIWDCSVWLKHIKIFQYIREEQFDVVHIHPQSQSILYAFDAKFAGVNSLIRTVHSNFMFEGILKWRETLFRMLMRKWGVRFVSISDNVAENEKQRFRNDTTIIYNWCDPKYKFIPEDMKREKRKIKKIPEEMFILLSIGNCANIKNHKMILEAIKMLDDKENFRYIHVGNGDLEERKMARELGIYHYIDFIGPGNPEEYLSISDCYVMTSKREGFGISALEAITCGLPVILTDVPGLRDFKKNEFDNVQFIDSSPEILKEKIFELMKKTVRNSLHQSNKAKAVYSMEKSVNQYIQLYKNHNN